MATDWNDREHFRNRDEQSRRSGSQLDRSANSPFGMDRTRSDRSSQTQDRDYYSRDQGSRSHESQNYYDRDQGSRSRDFSSDRDRDRLIERGSSQFGNSSNSDIYYGSGNYDNSLSGYEGRSRSSNSLGMGSRNSVNDTSYGSGYSSYGSGNSANGGGYSTYGRDNDLSEYSGRQMRPSFAGKGPKGWTRSDERIKEQVCDALERDHHIDASDIEVEVNEGVVTLKGNVQDRRTKRLAEDCVEYLSGVKDVRNEISVNASFFEQAKEVLTGESPSEKNQIDKSTRSSRLNR